MGDKAVSGDNSKAEAVEAANDLVDRLQDEIDTYVKPTSTPDQQRDAVEQMIGDLEASPEVRTIREAGDEDPGKFGSSANPEGRAPRREYDEPLEKAEEGERELRTGEADFSKESHDRVTGPLLDLPET
ncbi:hypothetical protein [Caulobacter sp. X]|uniref:hypothetical protein n=1 Tax=Caulobacter sp. X TaxID=2048901 RepID=UPI000C152E15|nr:hypothetical protein [Caulobacter sp. X]PIB95367.1 hypothetical protein CSW60_22750 [Caulobacter sp. X]